MLRWPRSKCSFFPCSRTELPSLRTTVTELGTGLGMLGFGSLPEVIEQRPPVMVSVSPETWMLLERSYRAGGLNEEFESAWSNGRAFFQAKEGLRGRAPISIEWKGSQRAPGDEVAPVDLRVDHVFLVSCKYLSRITINASPFNLFDRLLEGGQGFRNADWFAHVARPEYETLYQAVRRDLGNFGLPASVMDLQAEARRSMASALAGHWPTSVLAELESFVSAVSRSSAQLWRDRVSTTRDAERLLWRMLRIGSAPYFVLGTSSTDSIRLRVATPWDWRLDYRLKAFEISPQAGGQPRVAWRALVDSHHSGTTVSVEGHIEIRWAHGRFGGFPEAKVYLDTPHRDVPGYYPLI